ncbi:MAG: MFS transporter [Actinomycetota bacterium]|nr:MFS transporter [Actinomycetota bacterium]
MAATTGRTDNPYRWRLLAVTCGLYIGFGLVSASLAPLVAEISADLDLSRSTMGVVLGAWQFVYLVAAIPCGKFLDRHGLRRGLLLGIGLICLSGILRAGAFGLPSLLLAVGVFGLGGPLVSVGAPTLVASWFSTEERGLATGLVVSGPVVGSMFTLLTANSMLMPFFDQRWQLVVASYAFLAASAGAAFAMVTRAVPPGIEAPWGRNRQGQVPLAQLVAVPLVRVVLVMAILTFFINHAMSNWLPEMLRDLGLSPAAAGAWSAVVAVPGLLFGVLVPRLTRPSIRRPLLVGCYVVLGLALLPLGERWGWPAALGILAYGAIRSVALPVAMLFLMDDPRVGPANMASAASLYFTAGEVGGLSGPLTVGFVADRSGFGTALWVLTAVSWVLAGLAILLRGSGVDRARVHHRIVRAV